MLRNQLNAWNEVDIDNIAREVYTVNTCVAAARPLRPVGPELERPRRTAEPAPPTMTADDKPYHHGDLRRALLDASLELLAESGPQALTLREVARRAGVSHAAPYRHFADKDELVAAVAEEGFATLRERMLAAAAVARTSIEALERSGVAYVRLALEHPAHCAVMFGRVASDLKQRRVETGSARLGASLDAGHAAYDGLVQLVVAAQRDGFIRAGDPEEYAHIAWATVHGIATLAMARMFEDDDERPWPDELVLAFTERAVANLSRGFAPDGRRPE